MVKKIALLLLPVLLSGCELFLAPDHSNPFDSAYALDETGYVLTMTVSAGQINLSWPRSGDPDFARYRVITSPVRMDIKTAVLYPTNVPPAMVLAAPTGILATNLSFPAAGYPVLTHFAVIYESVSSDLGSVKPEASNIVTYEP
jgi:hypothetical protein